MSGSVCVSGMCNTLCTGREQRRVEQSKVGVCVPLLHLQKGSLTCTAFSNISSYSCTCFKFTSMK